MAKPTTNTVFEYGGKAYTTKRRFLIETGLEEYAARQWLRTGRLPDGSGLDVVYDSSSRDAYVSRETIERLKGRFYFVGHRHESPGSCRVIHPHQVGKVGTGSDNDLIPLRDMPHDQRSFMKGQPVLNRSTGESARLVRDSLTKEILVSSRAYSTFFGRPPKTTKKKTLGNG